MGFLPPEEQLRLLKRGVVDVVSEEELLKKLKRSFEAGKPLRVKAGFDPSFYSQIDDATPSPNVQAMLGTPAGHTQPLFRGVRGLKPDISFRTTQLATLLTELPSASLFAADLTSGNVDLLYKQVTDRGTRLADATTGHTRLRLQDAMMHLRSIDVGHQRDAVADVRILAMYDGTNAPIVPAGSVALSGTPTAAEYFGLGPVSINGSAINGVQECSINLNPQTIERGSDSDHYDTFAALMTIDPVITLRGLAIEPWTVYGLNGTALTSLSLWLRKLNNDASGGAPYVANATEQHILFTAAAGLITVGRSSGGGSSEVTTEIMLHLRAANASSAALTVDATAAIS